MLEKLMWLGKLSDAYGMLLTERQRMCLDLHYNQDLSLAEIAEQLGVSRQAVHDILKRSEVQLEEYEEKLALVAEGRRKQAMLRQVAALLAETSEQSKVQALKLIEQLLELPDEV